MSEKKTRRHFTAEQKAAVLKRHLMGKEPISDLCDELGIQPSLFYEWQRKLFDHAALALDAGRAEPAAQGREKALEDKVQALEATLVKKNSVIAEISAEFVKAKKGCGEP